MTLKATRSTCPYCGVGCGLAFGGPLCGDCETPQPPLLRA